MKNPRLSSKVLLCVLLLAAGFFSACTLFNKDDDDDGPTFSRQSSDWLFILYSDADNNLNDAIWFDLFSTECALADMRKADGSAKEGFPSVRAVVLWDGQSRVDAGSDGNTRIHPSAAIYELNAIDDSTYNGYKSGDITGWALGTNAVNMTSSASSWLPAEPDMGDVSKLTNYLKWVKTYFSADNVVLMLGDHGSGTEYESKSGSIYGSARSLCSDDTNNTYLCLSATDVKTAIADSGLEVDIIWMDCCLQGNAETAYILRGSAGYLVTSANLSYSHSYYKALTSLTTESTSLSFGQAIVQEYAELRKNMVVEILEKRASYDTVITQAQYDLSEEKQTALYTGVEELASALLTDGETVAKAVYTKYLLQDEEDVDECMGMAYCGTSVYLNDLGYLCKNLLADSSAESPAGVSEETIAAARTLMACIDDIVVTSWIGKKSRSDSQWTYQKNLSGFDDTAFTSSDGTFGLTIATQLDSYWLTEEGKEYGISYKYPFPLYSSYSTVTGYSSQWGEVMKIWHAGEY